jgi:hypothetical protein
MRATKDETPIDAVCVNEPHGEPLASADVENMETL